MDDPELIAALSGLHEVLSTQAAEYAQLAGEAGA
jgi:hypothetical protein